MKRTTVAAILAGTGLVACGKSTPTNPFNPTPTATPTTAAVASPTTATNFPPVLGIRTLPDPPTGTAPFTLTLNMCTCSDPEKDPLKFELKWGDGNRSTKLSGCRFPHTYNAPGTYNAFFCVADPVNVAVCKNYTIQVN
jgi:hypothetical protein